MLKSSNYQKLINAGRLLLLMLVVFVSGVSMQTTTAAPPAKKIKIVLLGTFHFGATNDKNRNSFDDEFSPKRQGEIDQIVNLLAAYAPNKIFVEQEPSRQAKWDAIYADYKRGIEPTGNDLKNEIFQLGIKLAKKTGDPRGVICVDYQMPTDFDAALKNAHDEVERSYIRSVQAIKDAPEPKNTNEKFFFLPFQASKDFKPLKLPETSLLDYYLWMNTPEFIARNHYLNDNYLALALGENRDYVGAEYVSLWYNRSLKILTNIMRNSSLDDDRYLLIIGSGHIKVLRDFFADHPYFEVVEVADVLGSPAKAAGSKARKSVE